KRNISIKETTILEVERLLVCARFKVFSKSNGCNIITCKSSLGQLVPAAGFIAYPLVAVLRFARLISLVIGKVFQKGMRLAHPAIRLRPQKTGDKFPPA